LTQELSVINEESRVESERDEVIPNQISVIKEESEHDDFNLPGPPRKRIEDFADGLEYHTN